MLVYQRVSKPSVMGNPDVLPEKNNARVELQNAQLKGMFQAAGGSFRKPLHTAILGSRDFNDIKLLVRFAPYSSVFLGIPYS